jgi:hypothetical protein
MNCFSNIFYRYRRERQRSIRGLLLCTAWLAACGAPASETEREANDATRTKQYSLLYRLTPDPDQQTVAVELKLTQDYFLLRELRFTFDPEHVIDIEGDGGLTVGDSTVRWIPNEDGGTLRWLIRLPNRRNGNGYDAWIDEQWGIFRAEDVIPRAASRTLKGAYASTEMEFRLPRAWSVVTEYQQTGKRFAVDKSTRRFDQPSGWIVMGHLGVRRDRIRGIRVAIAAPEGSGARRLDMLALLNWTLPELARLLPKLPSRLTIVSAGQPMWRGALSAPQSIYVHADRPLISENGTSTLLHEVMHVALGKTAEDGYDWIVEGLAEYYSLQLLRRSGGLTATRYERAMERQREWSKSSKKLCASVSTGARTARAVVVLEALAAEISTATSNAKGLDDVVTELLRSDAAFNLDRLRQAATDVLGQNPDALHSDKLPGCRTIKPADSGT